jgi:hypothetical protein
MIEGKVMGETIGRDVGVKKGFLLEYYRDRASELISELRTVFSDSEYKERSAAVNKGLVEAREKLVKILEQNARRESWTRREILEGVLMITYTNYVVMIESRNELWPYEYMTFARRVGELWEPFCQLCWEYPLVETIKYFVPPLFRDVKNKLTKEIEDFIDDLNISPEQRAELKRYYQKVWSLVTSGEIKLELDLHFEDGDNKYVVDFKSGFSSNEKGNTNRLLLVASVYKILEGLYRCLLFVRSEEDQNNHYLQTLKNSGLWAVYCGEETYRQIKKFTGFDLSSWLRSNARWEHDFKSQMYAQLQKNDLTRYLKW